MCIETYFSKTSKILIFVSLLFISFCALATHHNLSLTVDYKTVQFAGKPRKAISVNQQIPAPTLRFKQGDTVTIHVQNNLDQETAIHWHGLIIPWQMDGVLGITQKGIAPGGSFDYQFKLYQSGSYWYHAHAGLQEQQGLYGALIIDPLKASPYKYSTDYPVVLSDWSNTNPEHILANLKRDGDYYAPKFPLQASLVKFIHDYKNASAAERKNLLADYKMMQQMRMGIYDLSDVAYDAFLINGHPKSHPWKALVKVGDKVRLRFVGAGGSTIFKVKIPGSKMQLVHVQGNDIQPVSVSELEIAPGETYDVLVKIEQQKPYPIYAESLDTVGSVYALLVTDSNQKISNKQIPPFPTPDPVTRDMMSLMMSDSMPSAMSMDHSMPMDHSMHMNHNMPMDHSMHMQGMSMDMPTEASIHGDQLLPYTGTPAKTTGTTYTNYKAAVKTNDPNKPIYKVINMELFGYMGRYIWFINGVPEDRAHPILLEPNKRYRFVFTNTSMMRHPMHLHGHWFILRTGQGSYDPLLHTMVVMPGATLTADVDTDASGQWMFHCHFLYHMMSGMSRVFQYSTLLELTKNEVQPEDISINTNYKNRPVVRVDTLPIDKSMVKHPMAHPMGIYQSNFLELGADPFHNTQRLTFRGLYGKDYNKLLVNTKDAELYQGEAENADIDVFYWHLLSQFWAIKGGVNYTYRPALTPYWQPGIGIEGLMPYFIDTDIRTYYVDSSLKLDIELGRDTQLSNNILIRTAVRGILASHTVDKAQVGNGLNQLRFLVRPYYRVMPGLIVFTEYEHEQNYGTFKSMQLSNNEPATQDTVSLGFSVLF